MFKAPLHSGNRLKCLTSALLLAFLLLSPVAGQVEFVEIGYTPPELSGFPEKLDHYCKQPANINICNKVKDWSVQNLDFHALRESVEEIDFEDLKIK